MATRARNLRQIVVGGVEYQWRSSYEWLPVSPAWRDIDAFVSRLVVFRVLGHGRAGFKLRLGPDDVRAERDTLNVGVAITPQLVREAIEFALAQGWDPNTAAGLRELTGFGKTGRTRPEGDAPP